MYVLLLQAVGDVLAGNVQYFLNGNVENVIIIKIWNSLNIASISFYVVSFYKMTVYLCVCLLNCFAVLCERVPTLCFME